MYWAAENHRVFIEKELNLPGVTVWCGMSTRGERSISHVFSCKIEHADTHTHTHTNT